MQLSREQLLKPFYKIGRRYETSADNQFPWLQPGVELRIKVYVSLIRANKLRFPGILSP